MIISASQASSVLMEKMDVNGYEYELALDQGALIDTAF
jgi:hypothetical protein